MARHQPREDVPPPGAYNLAQSIGRQSLSTRPTMPSASFNRDSMKFSEWDRELRRTAATPAPGKYHDSIAAATSLGRRQVNASLSTAPRAIFERTTRDDRSRAFPGTLFLNLLWLRVLDGRRWTSGGARFQAPPTRIGNLIPFFFSSSVRVPSSLCRQDPPEARQLWARRGSPHDVPGHAGLHVGRPSGGQLDHCALVRVRPVDHSGVPHAGAIYDAGAGLLRLSL